MHNTEELQGQHTKCTFFVIPLNSPTWRRMPTSVPPTVTLSPPSRQRSLSSSSLARRPPLPGPRRCRHGRRCSPPWPPPRLGWPKAAGSGGGKSALASPRCAHNGRLPWFTHPHPRRRIFGFEPPPTGKVSPKKLVGTIFGERAGVLHSVAGNQPPEVFSERRHPHLSDFHGPVSPWLVASDFFFVAASCQAGG